LLFQAAISKDGVRFDESANRNYSLQLINEDSLLKSLATGYGHHLFSARKHRPFRDRVHDPAVVYKKLMFEYEADIARGPL